MGTIKYIAKTITETAESIKYVATNGNIEFNAKKEVVLQSHSKIRYDKYEPVESKNTEVEELRLNTGLDQGCHHDEAKGLRDGLIYGNVYEFEVVKFKANVLPKDERSIQWKLEFIYNGNHYNEILPGVGKIIKLKANLLEMCGRGFTLTAYISEAANGGKYYGWQHYRFRWFNREILKKEIQERTINNLPHKIQQSETSLCGMVCIFYFLAKYLKDDYKKLTSELHQKGEAHLNNYTIKPDNVLFEMKPLKENGYPYHYDENEKQYVQMPYADWVTMASTRNTESNLGYTGKVGQDISAINYPSLLIKLQRELLGFTNIVDYTDYAIDNDQKKMLQHLIDMQIAYQEGYKISMLVDMDLLYNKPTKFINLSRWHWIIYEGDIFIDEENNFYVFSYVCWGEKTLKKNFTIENFNSNFYGYIKAK